MKAVRKSRRVPVRVVVTVAGRPLVTASTYSTPRRIEKLSQPRFITEIKA